MSSFDEWFQRATGNDPVPYQRRFAEEGEISKLVDVPTGLDKRPQWRYWGGFGKDNLQTPTCRRRQPRWLVYCLPMRALVEQTRGNALLGFWNIKMLTQQPYWNR
jgi:CRISPR-associated endonuclease/helicase Cas3